MKRQISGTHSAGERCVEVPMFYFHVCDGHRFDEAEEGQELPDAQAARSEAIKSLRDLVAGDVCRGEANLGMFVEVEDADGRLLFTVSLEDAVQVRSERGTSPRR